MKKSNLVKRIKEGVTKLDVNVNPHVDGNALECPYLRNIAGEDHVVELFSDDAAEVVVYGGYKNQQEVETYWLNYEDLPVRVLKQIKEIVEDEIQMVGEE